MSLYEICKTILVENSSRSTEMVMKEVKRQQHKYLAFVKAFFEKKKEVEEMALDF